MLKHRLSKCFSVRCWFSCFLHDFIGPKQYKLLYVTWCNLTPSVHSLPLKFIFSNCSSFTGLQIRLRLSFFIYNLNTPTPNFLEFYKSAGVRHLMACNGMQLTSFLYLTLLSSVLESSRTFYSSSPFNVSIYFLFLLLFKINMYDRIQQNDIVDITHLYRIFLVKNKVLLIICASPNISGLFIKLPLSTFFQ